MGDGMDAEEEIMCCQAKLAMEVAEQEAASVERQLVGYNVSDVFHTSPSINTSAGQVDNQLFSHVERVMHESRSFSAEQQARLDLVRSECDEARRRLTEFGY